MIKHHIVNAIIKTYVTYLIFKIRCYRYYISCISHLNKFINY